MTKLFGTLAAGLVIGFAIATMLAGPVPEPAARPAVVPAAYFDADAPVAERLAVLEQTVAAERDARLVLEEQITLLLEAIDRIDASGPAVIAEEVSELVAMREQRASGREPISRRSAGDDRQQQVELLTGAGFGLNQAEHILDRRSQLQWEIMQDQYTARAEGRSFKWSALDANPDWRLRQELGDTDYERYLEALGQSTSVAIQSVYDSSPAARIGLQPGDRIVSYDGTRIFTMNELSAMTSGRQGGSDAVIEVVRNGSRMQLTVPPGPMGVQITGSWGTAPRRPVN